MPKAGQHSEMQKPSAIPNRSEVDLDGDGRASPSPFREDIWYHVSSAFQSGILTWREEEQRSMDRWAARFEQQIVELGDRLTTRFTACMDEHYNLTDIEMEKRFTAYQASVIQSCELIREATIRSSVLASSSAHPLAECSSSQPPESDKEPAKLPEWQQWFNSGQPELPAPRQEIILEQHRGPTLEELGQQLELKSSRLADEISLRFGDQIVEQLNRISPQKQAKPLTLRRRHLEDGAVVDDAALFDAVESSNAEYVRDLLEKGANPNATLFDKKFKGRDYTICPVILIAVLKNDEDIVRLLVESGANVSANYGFLAGLRQMPWQGTVTAATVATDKMSMLKTLVELRANLNEVASNGANLVWQSCYFGRTDILKYLLNQGVAFHLPAKSQDNEELSHPPLHIAAVMGREGPVTELLLAKATNETTNQFGLSPLDDAIINRHSKIVFLLVSHGADLIDDTVRRTLTETHVRLSVGEDKMMAVKCSLDLLFLMGNPCVIAEAARGLQRQDRQVEQLPLSFIIKFLSTSGDAPLLMLQAAFRKRDVSHWQQDVDTGCLVRRLHIKTAHIPKAQFLPTGDRIEFLNVAVMPFKQKDFQEKLKTNQALDPCIEDGLAELAPQDVRKGWRHTVYGETVMSSVDLYESLVLDICDLGIVRLIAESDSCTFEDKSCKAILEYHWQIARCQAVIDIVGHTMLLISFVIIAYFHVMATAEWSLSLQVGWLLGILAWSFEVISELSQIIAFQFHGWAGSYFSSPGNYIDILRIMADGYVLLVLISQDRQTVSSSSSFDVALAVGAFYKWVKVLYALTLFRSFGLSVLPILETMRCVGPFFTVMIFHFLGIWHAYLALNLEGRSMFESLLLNYRVGIVGEFPLDDLGSYSQGTDYYYIQRYFFAAVVLGFTVTLMNTFIAALGNSFSIATSQMEPLFQRRRANSIVTHIAIKGVVTDFVQRLRGSKTSRNSPTEPQNILWFCCAAESA